MIYQNGKALAATVGSKVATSKDVYSTEETVIGTWIDGKPLYRKCFNTSSPGKARAWTRVSNSNIDDLDFVTNIYGIYYYKNFKLFSPIPYTDGGNYTFSVCYNLNEGPLLSGAEGIGLYITNENYQNLPCVIFVEYTKTTDEATIQLDTQSTLAIEFSTDQVASMPVTTSVDTNIIL